MVPNAGLSTNYFRKRIRELQGFRAGVLEKVVPAFKGISAEAEMAAEAEFERLRSMPYDDRIDMGDAAHMAQDRAIAVYTTMAGVRQGVLNVMAVGLYHLFEQQQLFLLRRGLLSRSEADVPALFKVAEFEKRLAECGVKCRSFSCAGKLNELRTAANAIKHGPGPAGDARTFFNSKRPLTGDGLYVSECDLSEWCDAAIAFWEELSAIHDDQRLSKAGSTHEIAP